MPSSARQWKLTWTAVIHILFLLPLFTCTKQSHPKPEPEGTRKHAHASKYLLRHTQHMHTCFQLSYPAWLIKPKFTKRSEKTSPSHIKQAILRKVRHRDEMIHYYEFLTHFQSVRFVSVFCGSLQFCGMTKWLSNQFRLSITQCSCYNAALRVW